MDIGDRDKNQVRQSVSSIANGLYDRLVLTVTSVVKMGPWKLGSLAILKKGVLLPVSSKVP
jgi:hypothetical protein